MKRVTTFEYSEAERAALLSCEGAAQTLEAAQIAHDRAILRAVELGLPVREVGEWAGVSAAHVSRLSNGLYGLRHDS